MCWSSPSETSTAAMKLMRKLLKKDAAFVPERLVTDDLRSGRRGPGLGSNATMSAGDGRTTGAETFASANAAAGAQDQRFKEPGFSLEISFHTRSAPSTIPSTSNAISLQSVRISRGSR